MTLNIFVEIVRCFFVLIELHLFLDSLSFAEGGDPASNRDDGDEEAGGAGRGSEPDASACTLIAERLARSYEL